MGYNFIENFPAENPQTLCPTFNKSLAVAALLRYRSENPATEGNVNIIIDIKRRVVVINHTPTAEYSWIELGFKPD